MKKLSTFLKTLLVAVCLIGVGANAWAQSAYWTEDFEDALGTGWTLSTSPAASLVDNTSSSVDKRLGSKDLRMPKNGSYIITPSLSQGVSTITFWQCRSSNRTLTIYTSIDDGTNWTKHSDISANSSAIATVTINNPFVNRIKITNESTSDADLDDLTVYHKNVVWKENYESYTDVSQISSAWTNNGSNYQATLNLCSNECGNSSKWLLTYSGNESRQTTEYYMFASAYTGKAYRFDAKLNMNDGNNNSSESRLYIMNGAKASNNDNPSNYLFYIGVNSSGMAYISNGTDSETSTIGGLNSGTNSIAATKWSKNYRSTGWFDASCIIDFEKGTVSATFKSGSTEETKSLTLKSGTKQFSGISVLNGAKLYGVVAMDDIALYELAYPKFELSETLKEVAKGGNATVNVTDLIGEISITSADANIATASYADGTITINGVALGTTTLTVSCTNDGFTVTKEIAVTVEHGVTYNTPALYSEDFESYDIEKETPDNPKDAGWTVTGGTAKIEANGDASINQHACFNAVGESGNRGQSYGFANDIVTAAGNYWKIEFDAALTAGSDRTESSVAVTSAKSGDIKTNNAASGDLYFLCKQKNSNSDVYEVFLGNSTSEASATYTLTNGTFYHFVITYNGTTVTAKIGSNAKISKDVNASTVGALKGLKTCESRSNGYVKIDNITLHNFNGPAFTLAETEKTINQGGNGTVSVTDVEGEISVESSNTSVATASYADGTITITGVGGGTANITVNCFNNGVNAPAGTIATTIISYAEQYTTAKAVYDAKVANLDAAGQAYWTANVTDVASVVDAASCSAAIAALPTTYLAAVKAQGAGSDMTDAMPTGNTGWTVNQGNGPASYGSTGATETYSDGGATYAKFSTGNIMSQTITGLANGLYQVEFYGVVNAANNVSTVSGADLVQAYANDVNLDIDVVLQNSCTPTDYLRTIQAEVTDGTLTYGLKVKDEVTDAGNWAVAKTFKLTFLGDTKYNYTINAVAGETTIKQLGTGSEYPGLDYGAYVPYVIQYNSKYYVLDDNSTYYKNFTMGAADATKEVSYTLDESIAAFVEGESVVSDGEANDNLSNGYYGHVAGNASTSLGTLPAGSYTFFGMLKSDGNRGLYLRDASKGISTNIITYLGINKNSAAGIYSVSFNLPTETSVILTGYTNNHNQYNQSAGFDYVYIVRTGDLPATENIIVSDAGYATYVSNYNLDFTSATTKAYKVNVASPGVATMTQVDQVPAKTPVLLYKEGGNGEGENITISSSAMTAVEGNDLVAGPVATLASTDGDYKNMILNNVGGKIGFYFANGQTVAANRAYLHIASTLAPDASESRMVMVFADDEATAVFDLNDKSEMINDKWYDLQGRRVDGSRLNSGIYIKNGKKMVVK